MRLLLCVMLMLKKGRQILVKKLILTVAERNVNVLKINLSMYLGGKLTKYKK